MYKAKPVVVSDVGGLAHHILNGITGFVVPAGSVTQATEEALMALCQSPDLRKEMGAAGRERFKSDFEPTNLIERYVQAYNAVLTERSEAIVLSCASEIR